MLTEPLFTSVWYWGMYTGCCTVSPSVSPAITDTYPVHPDRVLQQAWGSCAGHHATRDACAPFCFSVPMTPSGASQACPTGVTDRASGTPVLACPVVSRAR